MAITVKHLKVSTVPDSGDTSLVEPSDWNADHVLTGTIPISNGGTGASTANDAFNALAPSQTGNSGKYLTTDGTNTSWAVNPLGTVTSVATGTGLTGGPITTSGTISFSNSSVATWAATPTSANLASAVTDETGSGSLVFSTAPTLNNPTISNYQAYTASSAPTYTAGLVWYDSSTSALAYYNNTTNNVLHIGQELQQQVRNSTGSTITKGSIVYISGATGQIGNITLAQANAYTSSQVIGVANQDIPNNTNGWVVTQGTITNFNTSGLTEGSPVYLSATTAGAFTSTEPNTPNYAVHMGVCLYSNINNGKIYINPINKSIDTGYIIGQIAIAQGGTNGTATPTSGAIAYGNGTAYAFSGVGTSGQVLTSQGSSAPTWTTPTTGTVTSVTGTAPISVATGTTTPAISISQATTSTNGYLSSTDWNTFNNKQPSGAYLTTVTADSPLTGSGTSASHLSIPVATSTANGYLSSTDWTTFNNKQPSGTYVTSVSGTTGRITSTGGVTPIIDLASGIATAGTTGSSTLIPVITVDTYGRVTTITTASNPQGTVTSVGGTGTVSGITLSGTVTSSGNLTLGGTLDLSSPPAIGGTTANTITGTTITGTKFVGISGGTF